MRRISKKQLERNQGKADESKRLHQLFLEIWDEREDELGNCYCFETGVEMHGSRYRSNSCCYDHVLEKSHYPDLAFDKRNILILHPDVHTNKGRDLDRVPKVKAYREKLLALYKDDRSIKEGLLE